VLGWSTASTAATAPSVGKLKFLPETAAVQRCLAELRAQHRDLNYIIGLSHAGTVYSGAADTQTLKLYSCWGRLQCSAAWLSSRHNTET
jgi:2',3'-cyclic-nucleotide 2'-phosphodiesterase (5'-nucleotidase family)